MDKQTVQASNFTFQNRTTRTGRTYHIAIHRTRPKWYRVKKTRKGELFITENNTNYHLWTLGHPMTQADFIN